MTRFQEFKYPKDKYKLVKGIKDLKETRKAIEDESNIFKVIKIIQVNMIVYSNNNPSNVIIFYRNIKK